MAYVHRPGWAVRLDYWLENGAFDETEKEMLELHEWEQDQVKNLLKGKLTKAQVQKLKKMGYEVRG